MHLGLVARLLPNATLIHCVRHPLDTCLSIFFQDFAGANRYARIRTHVIAFGTKGVIGSSPTWNGRPGSFRAP